MQIVDLHQADFQSSHGAPLKGGFPLGEIFRSNRNFYCSNSKDRRLVPSECLSDKRKFRFGRKIPPRGIGPLSLFSTSEFVRANLLYYELSAGTN
jgi:hypothetical protein